MQTPVKVKHLIQPTDNTCVCTCLAMLLDAPVNYLIETWHKEFWENEISLRNILDHYGMQYKEFPILDNFNMKTDVGSGILLVTAPSLNVVGGLHQLLIVYDEDTNIWNIFDPQAGTGYRYYTSSQAQIDENPNVAFAMVSWFIDAKFTFEEVIRLRKEIKEN